jgi:RimJ/RimL family protein N-acetyltransferase
MEHSSLQAAFDNSAVSPVEIRPFRPDEWQEFKRIRLESLKQDGAKFRIESRLELDLTDEQWRKRLKDADSCVAGAFDKKTNTAVGISIANRNPDIPTELIVGAVWIDKLHRGQNLPILMLAPFFEWLKDRPDIVSIETAHREGNSASHALMEKCGLIKFDRVEKDVEWFDGTVADKIFYKGTIPGRAPATTPAPGNKQQLKP